MRAVFAPALAFIAAAALAAAPALAAPFSPNPFNDRMRELKPVDQAAALRRAVTLDNQKCGRVAPFSYRGLYGNLGRWEVRCTPGGTYAVFVGPGGEVQVRACADLRSLKLPECTMR